MNDLDKPVRHIIARTKIQHVAESCALYMNDRFANNGIVAEWDKFEKSYLIIVANNLEYRECNGLLEAAKAFIVGRER